MRRDAGSQNPAAKIGQLALENDLLEGALIKAGLLVVQQYQLLKLARSTTYYQLTSVSESTQVLMRRIDKLHLHYPFAGA